MKKRTTLGVAAFVLLSLACGGKPPKAEEAPPGGQEAIDQAARGSAEELGAPAQGADPPDSPQPSVSSVHAQWIINEGVLKAEILLIGLNLADNATVTAESSETVVEKIEPDLGRTLVIVAMSPNAPAGDYAFQYVVPGWPPIPFTIHYKGPSQ
jgi:hypothetical protein